MIINYPDNMLSDLVTDHAGEKGAVTIYSTVSEFSGSKELAVFAKKHLASEISHLESVGQIIPENKKSRLLFMWIAGGYCIARFALMAGEKWVYGTVSAIEGKVVKHYQRQIESLSGRAEYSTLRDLLVKCQGDEIIHRDEADYLCGKKGQLLGLWCNLINAGSDVMVFLTRRF